MENNRSNHGLFFRRRESTATKRIIFSEGVAQEGLPVAVEIRPIQPDEYNQGLKLILAANDSNSEMAAERLVAFRAMADLERYDLGRQIVAIQQGRMVYAGLFVPHPGRVAFIFSASGDQCSDTDVAVKALRKLSSWSFESGCCFDQLLLQPNDNFRKQLCLQSGYRYLTDLIYLVRRMDTSAEVSVPYPDEVGWIEYSSPRYELFKQTISKTYQYSMDCPELETLRTIDDTLAGFLGSGVFNLSWWKLLCWQGEPAGVILLNRLSRENAMELVYMGLRPEFRGRKLGGILLNEALATVRQAKADVLTLAVDQRNTPAYQLYRRFGFEILLTRSVYYTTPELLGSPIE